MNFDTAFNALIGSEGGYSNDPNDPGGETMYGVTKRVALANGYSGDMRDLPLSLAKQIAKAKYWDAYQCDQYHPAIGFAVLDCAYNGGHPAHWLQQAAGVTVDGIIGAKTIGALRTADPMKIVMRFTALRLQYMTDLKIWPAFSRGWAKRIANNLMQGAA